MPVEGLVERSMSASLDPSTPTGRLADAGEADADDDKEGEDDDDDDDELPDDEVPAPAPRFFDLSFSLLGCR